MGKIKGLFLDRDGVLNYSLIREGKPFAPRFLCDFKLYEELKWDLFQLSDQGIKIIVVTNQPDLSTGKQTPEILSIMHEKLLDTFPIDEILTCPHIEEHGCFCRKPLPGLILTAAQKWDIDLESSILIGDRWRDIEAGIAAGCFSIFIDHGYVEKYPSGMDLTVTHPLDAIRFSCEKLLDLG
ncbi:HAD-IIIA family hydrolase [Kiloniella laminariae]|uniref:HAD-IIIA family hydrolase n=1 Tax=Kiloniella laminariae TaxID=454162 RepID=UPI00037F0594|nr:HAD-IIIA family hydrolase [Kiloniella laminariae]